VSIISKQIVRAAVLVCAVLALSAAPAAIAAPTSAVPCWKTLLNDWYDGTINNIYPLHCYDDAIRHLPTDVAIYSSAKEDFLAAKQAAAEHKKAPPEKNPPPPGTSTGTTTTAVVVTTTTTGTVTGPNGKTTTTTGTTTTTTTEPVGTTTTVDGNPPKKKHGLPGLLADITPGDPQAFPLPLLVLGALAILLVIAGGAGMIWQRTHPRDAE